MTHKTSTVDLVLCPHADCQPSEIHALPGTRVSLKDGEAVVDLALVPASYNPAPEVIVDLVMAGDSQIHCEVLTWKRTGPYRVSIKYRTPDTCKWLETDIHHERPPYWGSTVPGDWPDFGWSLTEENPGAGQKVQTDWEDTIMIPGGCAAATEFFVNQNADTVRAHQISPFGTPNITGGYISQNLGSRMYKVQVFGLERSAQASDFREYQAGDWVFLAPNCCPDNGGGPRPCPQECSGLTFEDPNNPEFEAFGPEDIVDVDDYIILPIRIGNVGPGLLYTHWYNTSNWGGLLDACTIKAMVFDVDQGANSCSMEIDGVGAVPGVPIRYVNEGEADFVNGGQAFSDDDLVMVLNKNGRPEPAASDLVVFSRCVKSPFALYFELEGRCIIWDFQAGNFWSGVTLNNGDPAGSWPVLKADISDWLAAEVIGEDSGEATFEWENAIPISGEVGEDETEVLNSGILSNYADSSVCATLSPQSTNVNAVGYHDNGMRIRGYNPGSGYFRNTFDGTYIVEANGHEWTKLSTSASYSCSYNTVPAYREFFGSAEFDWVLKQWIKLKNNPNVKYETSMRLQGEYYAEYHSEYLNTTHEEDYYFSLVYSCAPFAARTLPGLTLHFDSQNNTALDSGGIAAGLGSRGFEALGLTTTIHFTWRGSKPMDPEDTGFMRFADYPDGISIDILIGMDPANYSSLNPFDQSPAPPALINAVKALYTLSDLGMTPYVGAGSHVHLALFSTGAGHAMGIYHPGDNAVVLPIMKTIEVQDD